MKSKVSHPWLWMMAGLAAVTSVFIGCTGDSAENIVRQVEIIVEGFYVHPDSGSRLVANTTGAPVTSLSLGQSGDQLQGFDNNGMLFKGTIGRVVEGTLASFNLEGRTTGGEPVTITGNINVDGTTATMNGTWIEPNLASTVYGQATVPTNPAPAVATNGTDVTVSPSLASITPTGSQAFSASGGTAPYSWNVSSPGIGNITSITGTGNASATYSASGTGNNTVTVTDSTGQSASATVRQSTTDVGTGGSTVTLDPTLVTISSDGSASFSASGGSGTFSWSVTSPALGRISLSGGARNADATYTALAAGRNTVTARDTSGGSASATVIQEDTTGTGGTPPPPPGT